MAPPIRSAGVVLLGALAIDATIGIAHLLNLGGLPMLDREVALFDLNAERNLPTWWSSAKLLLIGAVLALLVPRAMARRSALLFVVGAVAMFWFLSLDEFASLHELLGRRTRSDELPVTGVWPFVYGAIGLIAAGSLLVAGRSILRNDRTATGFLAGGLVAFSVLAAGPDFVGNLEDPHPLLLQGLIFLEEMGELVAASVMLYGAWRLVAPTASMAPAP